MEERRLSLEEFVNGIRGFFDTIWELEPEAGHIYVWRDSSMPETERTVLDLRETVLWFYNRNVYGPDKQRWLEAFLEENLRAFARQGGPDRGLEVRLIGEQFGFEWHEGIFHAIPGLGGQPDRVLVCARNRNRETRAFLVERAVEGEYDYVAYVDGVHNSYILYTANPDSATPLPSMAGEDFEQAMIQYNNRYVVEEQQEQVIAQMSLPHMLHMLEQTGEYTFYCRIWEGGAIREKRLCCRYLDRAQRLLLLTRTDVTEIREERRQKALLQDALNAANVASKAKSEFLSRMSHDIRTPMNAIIGLTAIAGAHAGDPERVLDCLKKINSSSKLLLSLINEVLDMSKIESGRIVLEEEDFELSSVFQDLITIIQPEIVRKGHQLEVHIDHVEHELVTGDMQRLEQVLMNLLSNAVKYTPEHGHIVLWVTERPSGQAGFGRYEVTVEDNGIGIMPEFMDKLFEPFERADDEAVRRIQGTGLGMAISKNIVRMMDGDIRVDSRLGKGTRVTISVCLQLRDPVDDGASVLVDLSVLIADDDPVVCEQTSSCLNEIGMRSTWVQNGLEAVELVCSAHETGQDYFAVIVDLKMPGLGGIEVTRRIRSLVGAEVPIIVISAYDSTECEIAAQQAGANGFISKPLFRSKLVSMLRRFAVGELDVSHAPPAQQTDCSGKRILLVEDNELNLEIAMEIIGYTGATIDTAKNGQLAVDRFSAMPEHYYDLIFMDVQMPIMNGYEATKAIRALDRADAVEVPIIAMTANAFVEDVKLAKQSGMNEHISKPIDIGQLMSILQQWLS